MPSPEHSFATTFIDRFKGDTAYFLGTFWRFVDGQWAEWPFELLRAHIGGSIVSSPNLEPAAPGRLLRTMPDILREDLSSRPETWNTDPDALPCANGLLNIPQRTLAPLEAGHHQARTLAA